MSASELLESAKRHLDNERVAAALDDAERARDAFEKAGDLGGAAEAVRVVALGRRLEAEKAGERPMQGDQIANAALANYRDVGDKKGTAVMLLALAELNADTRSAKRRQKAAERCEEAAELLQGLGEKRLEGEALVQLAHICHKNKDAGGVLQNSTAALSLFNAVGDKRGEALALHGHALACVMNGNLKEGLDKASESVALLRELKLNARVAVMLRAVAQWYLAENDPDAPLPTKVVDALLAESNGRQAVQLAKKQLEWAGKGDSKSDQSTALQFLARAKDLEGDKTEAVLHGEEAVVAARASTDKAQILEALKTLVALRASMPRPDVELSLGEMSDAVDLAGELSDHKTKHGMLRAMAEIHRDTKDYDKALEEAERGRHVANLEGDNIAAAHNMLVTASTHGAREDFPKAVWQATQAKNLFEQAKDKKQAGNALNMIAEMSKFDGKPVEAEQAADEMIKIGKELGDWPLEKKAYQTKCKIHIFYGDIVSAEILANNLIEACKAASDGEGEASALLMLAEVRAAAIPEEDEYTDAVVRLALGATYEAGSLGRVLGKKEIQAHSAFRRSQLRRMSGRFRDAVKSAKAAQKLFQAAGDLGMVSCSMAIIGESQFTCGMKDEGRELVEKALVIAKDCGSDQGVELASFVLDRMTSPIARAIERSPFQALQDVRSESPGQSAVANTAQKIVLDPTTVRSKLLDLALDAMGGDEDLAIDNPLMDAGMDSLSSISFTNQVAKEFSLEGATSLVFDYPTVRAITEHIVEESKNT